MAIKFTYLKDSSPFTADALNARVADATDGINELKQEDIGHGAFRTEHLPTVIGVPGVDDPADQLFSVNNDQEFLTVYRTSPGAPFEISGAVLNYTNATGRPEIVQGGDTTALVILANLQVRRFLGTSQGGTNRPLRRADQNFEDLVSATFWIKVKVINPNPGGSVPELEFDIPHSARTISPGLTVVEIICDPDEEEGMIYNIPGRAYLYDDLTFKNVAIRTVLTGQYLFDLLGYAPDVSGIPVVGTYYQIDRISIMGQCRFCNDDFASIHLEYSKSNLTAIPVKAGVNTNE